MVWISIALPANFNPLIAFPLKLGSWAGDPPALPVLALGLLESWENSLPSCQPRLPGFGQR